MTNEINDNYKKGLLEPTFQIERNLLIWQYITDDVLFLEKQDKSTKALYAFIQQSALVNSILYLGKLFDTKKKYLTRCIKSFLELLNKNNFTPVQIVEVTNTKRLLQDFNCPNELVLSLDSRDYSRFPNLFAQYFLDRLNEPNLKDDIDKIKTIRDKYIAHNEVIKSQDIDMNVIKRLVEFTTELISIFGQAYHSTTWTTGKYSHLKASAETYAFFIKDNINRLKSSA